MISHGVLHIFTPHNVHREVSTLLGPQRATIFIHFQGDVISGAMVGPLDTTVDDDELMDELNDLVKNIDEETDEAEAESGRIADQDLIDRLNRLDAGVGDRVSGGDSKDRPKVADRSREKVPAS